MKKCPTEKYLETVMKCIYRICGMISLALYIFILYQLWHMCQYGGIQSHGTKLVVLAAGFALTFVLRFASKIYLKKKCPDGGVINNKIYAGIVVSVVVIVTLLFGGGIVYSAIPYNGALSWKIQEWMNKKEIKLEHNNIFDDGIEGILKDLDDGLGLPDKLYIANKFKVTFDEDGEIEIIEAFIYGKDTDGNKKTYLIDYDENKSDYMTVWMNGNVNGEYEEDMKLSPMLCIMDNSDWITRVDEWSEGFDKALTYEVLYMGRRSFNSDEGLEYVPGDADGDGVESGDANFNMLSAGGEMVGYEVSLYMPEIENTTPVRYIMEPAYVSQSELDALNEAEQVNEAKSAEGWTVDKSDGTMYFMLDEGNGWRMVVTDAACGSRFYVLENTTDNGSTWNCINDNPFCDQIGVAEGLEFFDENLGFAGLTGASEAYSRMYVTTDGGESFAEIILPFDEVTQLPETADEYGFTIEDYDYINMPEMDEDGVLKIKVTTEASEVDAIIFESRDNGITWEVSQS